MLKREKKKIILAAILLMCIMPLTASGQEDADYRMEIGGGVGASFYLGDLNNTMFSQPSAAASVYWRYLFDHYNSLKVNVTYAGVKGSTEDQDNFYPSDPKTQEVNTTPLKTKFTGSVIDLSCMYEINFLPYGYYQDFFGHKRFTPFLQLGLGMAYASKGKEVAFCVPMGVGVKYRISKRLNASFDWSMHFTTSDKIDGLQDPLGIKSEGFKNKDHYSIALLTLTYSFSPRCPNCNKAK